MIFKKHVMFVLVVLMSISLNAQKDNELFNGEKKLENCIENIPLTYKRKDNLIVSEKALELKGKEIVLLHFDKKSKQITYSRYYLVSEIVRGETFCYLVKKADYESNIMTALFLEYKSKHDRFYDANCFDSVLELNTELKALCKEEDL